MSFLKNIFGKKDYPINSYSDFWSWFIQHEKMFFSVVKNRKNIEKEFFDKLSPKLQELKEGYFYLTGMYNDDTVELVFTADGSIRNIVFVEDLVNNAPVIDGWKFTALKPALNIEDVNIEMADLNFNKENIYFYSNEFKELPDQINITIIHDDFTDENKDAVTNGIYIFLDNYLGELEFVSNIDELNVLGKQYAQKELVPIAKLKEFLIWRQKEFVEKYDGIRYDTENDTYSVMEGQLSTGNKLLAVVNNELLKWDSKASHPWISILTLKFDGDNNGMPNTNDYSLLNTIEDELLEVLKCVDGFLNIGRQTTGGEREIYFACKDFREPSKIFFQIQNKYSDNFEIDYDIYKDKYWQSFRRFNKN